MLVSVLHSLMAVTGYNLKSPNVHCWNSGNMQNLKEYYFLVVLEVKPRKYFLEIRGTDVENIYHIVVCVKYSMGCIYLAVQTSFDSAECVFGERGPVPVSIRSECIKSSTFDTSMKAI